jgi:hypothetical protein
MTPRQIPGPIPVSKGKHTKPEFFKSPLSPSFLRRERYKEFKKGCDIMGKDVEG